MIFAHVSERCAFVYKSDHFFEHREIVYWCDLVLCVSV